MDTNVAIVANGRTSQAGERCVEACIKALLANRSGHRILLDQRGEILEEYRRHLSPSGQPGPGDAFFKWLWDNRVNPEHCGQISITPTDQGGRGFEEFPDDPDLKNFDPSDRKFVAVSVASGEQPPILNAVDSDWWNHRETLERFGVRVRFVCPEHMDKEVGRAGAKGRPDDHLPPHARRVSAATRRTRSRS